MTDKSCHLISIIKFTAELIVITFLAAFKVNVSEQGWHIIIVTLRLRNAAEDCYFLFNPEMF